MNMSDTRASGMPVLIGWNRRGGLGRWAMSKDTRLVPLALVVCPFCVFGEGWGGGRAAR